jgi:hypothetical protein
VHTSIERSQTMRSLSASVLIALAAFVLGLAAAGRAPRDASAAAAASAAPAGPVWKSDGKNLTLTNSSTDTAYLAIGKLRKAGGAAPAPARAAGQVVLPVADVNGLVIYRVQAALLCERNGCRPCQPTPLSRVTDCPIPPPIPIGAESYEVNLGPRGASRP